MNESTKPIKLKHCPFCGTTDIQLWWKPGTLVCRGLCTQCGAAGAEGHSEREAANKWNRRCLK